VKYNTRGEAAGFFELTNLSENSHAGLYVSSKSMNYIGIESVRGVRILLAKVNNEVINGPEISGNSVMLRIVFEATKVWFEYSFDGLVYSQLGSEFKLSVLNSENNCIGFFCLNKYNVKGSVDVDWFYYKPRYDDESKFAEVRNNNIIFPEL
jgi:beta-xylosidase